MPFYPAAWHMAGFACSQNPGPLYGVRQPAPAFPMTTLFYAVCLVGGLLFTIVSAIMGHFFDGGHGHGGHVGTGGHAEAGFDDTGVAGISFFSPVVLACFITAFGGFGILFNDIPATANVWISAPLSIVC